MWNRHNKIKTFSCLNYASWVSRERSQQTKPGSATLDTPSLDTAEGKKHSRKQNPQTHQELPATRLSYFRWTTQHVIVSEVHKWPIFFFLIWKCESSHRKLFYKWTPLPSYLVKHSKTRMVESVILGKQQSPRKTWTRELYNMVSFVKILLNFWITSSLEKESQCVNSSLTWEPFENLTSTLFIQRVSPWALVSEKVYVGTYNSMHIQPSIISKDHCSNISSAL